MRLCFPLEKKKLRFAKVKHVLLRFCGSLLEFHSLSPCATATNGSSYGFFQALSDRAIFDYNCYGPASMNPMRPMNDENCVFPFSSFLTMEFQKR